MSNLEVTLIIWFACGFIAALVATIISMYELGTFTLRDLFICFGVIILGCASVLAVFFYIIKTYLWEKWLSKYEPDKIYIWKSKKLKQKTSNTLL